MKITHRRDYAEARRAEYPSTGDQLDALMKYFAALPEIPAEVQDWVDACMAVKEKYPKAE
jgi:hypothetical protein